MEFLNSILSIETYNVLITVIIIPLLYIVIQFLSEEPKLVMDNGSSGGLAKDAEGKDVQLFSIEVCNSPKFLGRPKPRRTALISGYDLYHSKKKGDQSVHPIFNKAEGNVQLPFELKGILYDSVSISFLAYYKNEKCYHIIERVIDDNSVILSSEKIEGGSCKINFILKDEISKEYNFKFTPVFLGDSLLPLRVKSLYLRYDYLKLSIHI